MGNREPKARRVRRVGGRAFASLFGRIPARMLSGAYHADLLDVDRNQLTFSRGAKVLAAVTRDDVETVEIESPLFPLQGGCSIHVRHHDGSYAPAIIYPRDRAAAERHLLETGWPVQELLGEPYPRRRHRDRPADGDHSHRSQISETDD